jgi:hypothetical protein
MFVASSLVTQTNTNMVVDVCGGYPTRFREGTPVPLAEMTLNNYELLKRIPDSGNSTTSSVSLPFRRAAINY